MKTTGIMEMTMRVSMETRMKKGMRTKGELQRK